MWMAYAAGGLVLFAAGMLTGYLLGRSARERAVFDAQIDAFEQRIELNRAPRHAARSPRGTPGGAMVPGESPGQPKTHRPVKQHPPAPRRLARDPGGPWYWRHPAPGTTPRAVTTAADIAPVFLPVPGVSIPLRPQPGRDSGAGTGTLPRLTDTGELRAIAERADEFIARLQRDGDRYREELSS